MRVLPAALVAAVVVAAHSPAEGAGFYLTDVGTRGMARGGALIAAPNSLTALHYNPAGLALLDGIQAEASLTLVAMDVSFQRKCPCVDQSLTDAAAQDAALEARYADPVDTNTMLQIPFLGVGYRLPWLDTTIGLAVWGPNSGRHNYGEDVIPSTTRPDFVRQADLMPNRYSGISVNTIEANLGLGFGFRPFKGFKGLDGLRFGAVLIGYQSGNNQRVHLWINSTAAAPDGPEDAAVDAPVVFKFRESFALNWAVGMSYEVIPGLSLGASFRGQRNIKAGGTIDVELPAKVVGDIRDPDDDLVKVTGNEVDVALSTAPIFRSGIEYIMPGVFAAELAWVWEGWSAHDKVVINPRDISFDILGTPTVLGEIVAERRWENTWSLRLGGELHIFDPYVTIMGGYYFEPTAVPQQRVDPSRIDLDKHGMSLGLATTWYGVTLQVAFQYVALVGAEVRDSEQVQIAPLVDDDGNRRLPEFLTNIGNGDYSGQYFLTSFSLSYAHDFGG